MRPPTWPRSINDLLRHTAYVEHYIIEKLIMDQEPKTILPGSLLPAEDYPTFEDCIKLMHDVHDTTMIAFAGLTRDDLSKSILAFNLSYMFEEQWLLSEAMERIGGWLEEGAIKAPPVKTYPMAKVGDAHRDIESGQTVGKLVLIP